MKARRVYVEFGRVLVEIAPSGAAIASRRQKVRRNHGIQGREN